MPKTINKTGEGSMYALKVLFLLILAVLVAYLLMIGKSKTTTLLPAQEESVESVSDLDRAQDQLDTVNVDSVDTGVNQLSTEVSAY